MYKGKVKLSEQYFNEIEGEILKYGNIVSNFEILNKEEILPEQIFNNPTTILNLDTGTLFFTEEKNFSDENEWLNPYFYVDVPPGILKVKMYVIADGNELLTEEFNFSSNNNTLSVVGEKTSYKLKFVFVEPLQQVRSIKPNNPLVFSNGKLTHFIFSDPLVPLNPSNTHRLIFVVNEDFYKLKKVKIIGEFKFDTATTHLNLVKIGIGINKKFPNLTIKINKVIGINYFEF